jgi:hypothetical protein
MVASVVQALRNLAQDGFVQRSARAWTAQFVTPSNTSGTSLFPPIAEKAASITLQFMQRAVMFMSLTPPTMP